MTSVTRLTAVYPGTFDPMTLGHEDLMRRASRLFERLLIAVAAGHHKRTMFSVAERLEIATELASRYPNVEVMSFRGLLRDFVVAQGGGVVVRGLRAETVRVERADALQWMARAPAAGFDVVFVDPPFDSPLLAPALASAARIVVAGGFVYAEGPTPVDPGAMAAAGLAPWRADRAGAVHFELLRRAPLVG